MPDLRHLVLEWAADPPLVIVSLNGEIEELVWLRLRGLFSSDAHESLGRLSVSPQTFLSLAPAVKKICSRHHLGLRPDDGVLALLNGVKQLHVQLEAAYAGPAPLSAHQLSARLAGGRFVRTLTDFQTRDLSKVLTLPHGANFSVPGAGKTTVAYGTYEAERLAGRVDRLAVVGPLSSFDAWMGEADECFSDPPKILVFTGQIDRSCEVLLVNYQRLTTQYAAVAEWVASSPTHLVLDEAHRMKRGWEGAWGSACLKLSYLARRRDVLTGTPAPQGLEDLLALLDFLWPNVGRRRIPPRSQLRGGASDVVNQVSDTIKPLFVRTRKVELGLRDPSFTAVLVPLDGLHEEIYCALRDQYAGVFRLQKTDRLAMARMGQIVMYLIEAATNPALLAVGSSPDDPIIFRHPPLPLPDDGRLIDLLRTYGEYETPKKFEELARLVHANAVAGRKTLVWTNFVRNIATLERMFARYHPAKIHGGVPLDAPRRDDLSRTRELRRFREDPDCLVMIANPAAAGEGISLHQVCHDAVYLDRTFNAGQYLQSLDRIHRLGLGPKTETRVSFLIGRGTIDEVIDRRVRDKAERLGVILDDPDIASMALPDEEEYGAPVDHEDDVLALFVHLLGSGGQ